MNDLAEYLSLTLLLFLALVGALLYWDYTDRYEVLETKLKFNKKTVLSLLTTLIMVLINSLLLQSNSLPEILLAFLFFFLNFIFFILVWVRKNPTALAVILATICSELIFLLALFTRNIGFNDLFLLIAYLASAVLILKTNRVSKRFWSIIFLLMMGFDILFVWIIPVAAQINENVKPFLFSPLFKIGLLSIGSGDLFFLFAATILLAKDLNIPKRIFIAALLSATHLVLYGFHQLIPSIEIFPFMLLLTPTYLLLTRLLAK